MISSNDLTEEQRRAVADWASQGSQLADIQKRLGEEFGLSATFMDTRFLVLDLGIELQSAQSGEEPREEVGGEDPVAPGEAAPAPGPLDPAAPPATGGRVTVTTDQVTRPGTMVSGSATFSDGVKAQWYIDQMGRPGLEPETPGYQPVEADLVAFEEELRRLLG